MSRIVTSHTDALFPNGREHRSTTGSTCRSRHRLFFSTLPGPLPISTAKLSILHTVNDIAVPFDATAALIVNSMFKNGALNPEPDLRRPRQVECHKARSPQHLVVRALRDGQLARGLPQSLSIRWTMRRVSVSVVMLAALLGMYWPDVAWIALFNTATGAFARHIRQ